MKKIEKFSTAGITFELFFPRCEHFSQKNTIEKLLHEWMRGYVVDTEVKNKPDYKIHFIFGDESITGSHMTPKKDRQKYSIELFQQKKSNIYVRISISLEEFFIILSMIITLHFLLHKSGLILHASSTILPSESAAIFLGKNGAGKSTILKLLYPVYKPLSDDLVYIIKKRGKFYVGSSIRTEKESWFKKTNEYYPLDSIFIIKQTAKNNIIQLSKESKYFDVLFKQLRLDISNDTKKTMFKLFAGVSIKQLNFNLNILSLEG